MLSKAEYLKRYMNPDDLNKTKKRKKPSKVGNIKVVDAEVNWRDTVPSMETVEDAWDRQGEEDKPVTVEVEGGEYQRRGQWASINEGSPPRRRRHDSDNDASPPRRRRHDSDNDASPPRRRRHDSDNDASPPRRRRYDSDNDASPPRRRRQDGPGVISSSTAPPASQSDIESSNASGKGTERVVDMMGRRLKTAAGHNAGLQSASSFGEMERVIQEKKLKELKDSGMANKQEDTVYRDKRGRKLDMLNEFMRQQAARDGKEVKLEKAQYEWGKGVVQKEAVEDAQQEMQRIAAEPFARTIEDPRMEEMRKSAIRDGDPMADYFNAKAAKAVERTAIVTGKPLKPVYQGPAAPPNRFHIRPGYRWDAIDRGNKFENDLLKKLSDRGSMKEDEYRWSVSDM